MVLVLERRAGERDAPAHGDASAAAPLADGEDGIVLTLLELDGVRERAALPAYARALPATVDEGAGQAGAARTTAIGTSSMHMVAALDGDDLVGHAWFARGRIAPSLNRGGERFAGIGLSLPPAACYAFKVQVAPGYRRRGLGTRLLAHGARHLPGAPVSAVVTTTDRRNAAFRASAAGAGFERRDWAGEIVVGGRRLYRLPRPVRLGDGTPGRVRFFTDDRPPSV